MLFRGTSLYYVITKMGGGAERGQRMAIFDYNQNYKGGGKSKNPNLDYLIHGLSLAQNQTANKKVSTKPTYIVCGK